MSTKLTLRTIQFSAPVEAVCCSLGSVIAMQSDVVQWAVGGRVQAGSTLNTLSVDRTDLTFATAAGWTVSVQHPVVQRGTAQVQSVSGLNVTMTAALPTGRIVKAVDGPGNEYIVTGYSGSTITLAGSTGSLAAGNVLTLYDANVIDNMSVVSVAITPGLGAVVSISGQFSAVPSKDSAWAYGQSAGAQPAKLFRVVSIKKSATSLSTSGHWSTTPSSTPTWCPTTEKLWACPIPRRLSPTSHWLSNFRMAPSPAHPIRRLSPLAGATITPPWVPRCRCKPPAEHGTRLATSRAELHIHGHH